MDKPSPSQADKFEQAAREHECDEDEGRWDERLKKVAMPRSDRVAPSRPANDKSAK